uniref:Calponin-homology (CH) domain-containing protein n=1 Tax=Parascaris equorum TaxID=6256 RepID=A0A914RDN5_PAREQ
MDETGVAALRLTAQSLPYAACLDWLLYAQMNNALVLNFLENEEHIKIVNIDSSAIVDRNLKLILGLVWTLVLHYSIAQQIWELPEDSEKVVERSPKEKLMLWIRGKLPDDINLKNFTSDWNSGILLGALSTRIAMDVAEKHLSVVPHLAIIFALIVGPPMAFLAGLCISEESRLVARIAAEKMMDRE